MDQARIDWVTSEFKRVDSRFGDHWSIPFEDVQSALHRYDTYWDNQPPGVTREKCGGLIRLCAPGACDYGLLVTRLAGRVRDDNLKA